jgi:transcriptional regulator with XRE-family HTH domain
METIHCTPLGKLLRHLRFNKGVMLYHFSLAIGISSAEASAIELGKKRLDDKLLQKISAYFGLTEFEAGVLKKCRDGENAVISKEESQLFFDFFSGKDDERKKKIRKLMEGIMQ